MDKNVCNLIDNLTKHNSRAFGYELSRSEILQILKLFDEAKELEQYRAIGTIEEFKALKGKNTSKKVTAISLTHEGRVGNCPNCNQFVLERKHKNCPKCRRELDWR